MSAFNKPQSMFADTLLKGSLTDVTGPLDGIFAASGAMDPNQVVELAKGAIRRQTTLELARAFAAGSGGELAFREFLIQNIVNRVAMTHQKQMMQQHQYAQNCMPMYSAMGPMNPYVMYPPMMPFRPIGSAYDTDCDGTSLLEQAVHVEEPKKAVVAAPAPEPAPAPIVSAPAPVASPQKVNTPPKTKESWADASEAEEKKERVAADKNDAPWKDVQTKKRTYTEAPRESPVKPKGSYSNVPHKTVMSVGKFFFWNDPVIPVEENDKFSWKKCETQTINGKEVLMPLGWHHFNGNDYAFTTTHSGVQFVHYLNDDLNWEHYTVEKDGSTKKTTKAYLRECLAPKKY